MLKFWTHWWTLSCVICLFGLVFSARGKVIRFPDQELASDYVFPVFENPKAVLRRNVNLKHRFEFKMSSGLRADEPLYHKMGFEGSLAFYFTEFSGLGLSGLFFMPGLSKHGRAMQRGIKQKDSADVSFYLDVGKAPAPLVASFLNYHFVPLYGKISLTKKIVFNFSLLTVLGGGLITYKQGSEPLNNLPVGRFSLGQRLYFNSYVALEGMIDFLVYRGTQTIHPDLKYEQNEPAAARPPYGDFEKDLFFRLMARLGLTIVL